MVEQMIANKVKELIRIRNILASKDKLISKKDMTILDALINLPDIGVSVHECVQICDNEIREIELCFQ